MENMIDLTPSPEVIDGVRKEFGLDERQIKESVKILKEWLRQQPHIPDDPGKKTLHLTLFYFMFLGLYSTVIRDIEVNTT